MINKIKTILFLILFSKIGNNISKYSASEFGCPKVQNALFAISQ